MLLVSGPQVSLRPRKAARKRRADGDHPGVFVVCCSSPNTKGPVGDLLNLQPGLCGKIRNKLAHALSRHSVCRPPNILLISAVVIMVKLRLFWTAPSQCLRHSSIKSDSAYTRVGNYQLLNADRSHSGLPPSVLLLLLKSRRPFGFSTDLLHPQIALRQVAVIA